VKFKLHNKASFSQCGNGDSIGPVNEYGAQSTTIPFVGIIMRKGMSCDNSAISFFYSSACCDKERKLALAGDKM
jgi:hypothetical protein